MSSEGKISKRRPATFIRVGLAAIALSLFQLVPAAGAGIGTLAYPATDVVVPNVEPGVTSTSVPCPTDHPVVTAGGVEITGDESTVDLEVNTSLPSKGLKGWKAAANNSSASDASMHATAICAKGHVTLRQVKKTVKPGRQGGAKATCPRGTTVIGGGVGITGGNHAQEVATSAPFDGKDRDKKPDDGWVGRGNNALLTQATLTVAAICALAGKYSYVHSAPLSVASGTQNTDSVSCPSASSVTGGGVTITGRSLGTEVGDSFPIDGVDVDTTPNNGWQASANNDFTGSSTTMQVFAICHT